MCKAVRSFAGGKCSRATLHTSLSSRLLLRSPRGVASPHSAAESEKEPEGGSSLRGRQSATATAATNDAGVRAATATTTADAACAAFGALFFARSASMERSAVVRPLDRKSVV